MSAKKTVTKKPVIKEVPRYGKRCLGKGIYISNDSRVTHLNCNDLIIGSSGSCKTGSIVYTQLKTLNDSSLIVADSKNMLYRMFKDELEKKGYKVRVLDFVNPEQSCLYNPLDYIRRNADGSYNEIDIMKAARSLIPDSLDGHDPFWAISGRAVLEFFISYTLSALPEEDHNMYTVSRLYRAYTREMGESAFIDWIEDHPGSFTSNRYTQIKGMQNADKTWSSILGFVNVALYPFDVAVLHHIFDPNMNKTDEEEDCDIYDDMIDEFMPPDFDCDDFCFDDESIEDTPEISEADIPEEESCSEEDIYAKETSSEEECPPREELKIESLGKEKTVVFLNISDTDHSIDSLVNLFYTQALQTLVSEADKNDAGQLTVPCRIIFDDFASGTTIPDFDKVISVIRSRDIWVTISLQSLSQLESLYSHPKSLTIQNNCDHIVYMGSNDLSSAEYIGTRAGRVPEVILSMDRKSEYFIEGGKKAVLVDKVPPYSYSEETIENECEVIRFP
ncbi:MAG: type IV secretory system conjugative DNA transfer family protein [Lachnospiraceae bacterium]|nr:type IV secretory system conjugative DNA transfer family protein [Lachnospiraceae bacterium]